MQQFRLITAVLVSQWYSNAFQVLSIHLFEENKYSPYAAAKCNNVAPKTNWVVKFAPFSANKNPTAIASSLASCKLNYNLIKIEIGDNVR